MSAAGWPGARLVELPRRDSEEPITLAVHEAGEGPAVVLSHGFPELAYSWRHQLPAIAAAGFRAIAPDQRGYGGSSAPRAVEAYGDLVRLLDALGIEMRSIERAGHWVQQERPDEVSAVLIDWLRRRFL